MFNSNQKLLVASAIALVTLVGGYESPVFANHPKASVAATSSKTSEYTSLQSVVSRTMSAVEAGKFAIAKEEFNKFEPAWKKVEDNLKKKSPDSYKMIEDSKGMFMKEVKATKPNKAKLMAELQSLDKAIAKASK